MKIGAFAKKFGLNISTVRFYVNHGLLTPRKIGGQYDFDETAVTDMQKILKYKQFDFTLEEIQLLFFMETTSHYNDDVVLEVCTDLLSSKRDSLLEEQAKIARSIKDLEREIRNLPASAPSGGPPSGVPFAVLPRLYCPDCHIPLQLDSASLSGGSIQKGLLSCGCGYRSTIEDGIIFPPHYAEDTPFKAFDNIDSVMAMKNQFSPLYRKLLAKCYIWMYNQMAGKLEEPRCFMVGPFTFNFLLGFIERLGKKHLYIVFDPSAKRISKLKKYLSVWNDRIVYMVGDASRLPIQAGTADCFIDDYSTSNSLFTYGGFSTESLAPLIKPGGDILGVFTTYAQAPKSLRNFRKSHPGFPPDKMTLAGLKYQWSLEKIEFVDKKLIGTTTPGEIHFPQNELGEPVEIHGYHARKAPAADHGGDAQPTIRDTDRN